MSEVAERAHEAIHEHGGGHADPWNRGVAVLVSVLAAALALTEVGAKSTQNEYLTHHIAVSDDWAFYQARNTRATVREAEAALLSLMPNASDPAVQTEIKAATEYAKRMRDDPQGGMVQLMAQARDREHERNEAFHRYHIYEYAAGALQIAIVLATVSVVTRIRSLALTAGGIGLCAGVAALATWFGVV